MKTLDEYKNEAVAEWEDRKKQKNNDAFVIGVCFGIIDSQIHNLSAQQFATYNQLRARFFEPQITYVASSSEAMK
jgi:hypothetical protein